LRFYTARTAVIDILGIHLLLIAFAGAREAHRPVARVVFSLNQLFAVLMNLLIQLARARPFLAAVSYRGRGICPLFVAEQVVRTDAGGGIAASQCSKPPMTGLNLSRAEADLFRSDALDRCRRQRAREQGQNESDKPK
jgi:hypothetical protein